MLYPFYSFMTPQKGMSIIMGAAVGVIIPVYNVEQYLVQCLDSVCNQTLASCSIDCINYGSTDQSTEILRQYADRYPNIYLIEQENSGYGAAVNKGLSVLDTAYVNIIEPDDFVDPFHCERLYDVAVKCGTPDIVKFAYYDYFEVENGSCKIFPSQSSQLEPYLQPFQIRQYPDLLLYHPSIWTCIYRLGFLRENQIRFIEAPGAGWTDNPFFISTMCKANSIMWSNERHYYYRRTNPNASSNLKDCKIPLLRALELLDFIQSDRLDDPVILRYIYKRCMVHIQIVSDNEHYDPVEDGPLLQKIVAKIPTDILKDSLFTPQECALYRVFRDRRKLE